ncbi:MAG: DUF2530 domain-containing protein [Actinomycetota bacterium]|jgi:hypothetical protein|nr:DUF2530 domain-containing protein [Pseudonocardiales bacterium]MDQ3601119.1 DUF2530 domain-containing protein [Actinomycetota bacterium]
MTPPPPLPPSLADPRPVVAIGTLAALAAAAVLAVAGAEGIWVWSCLTGGGLGLVGFRVMQWQHRSATRRSATRRSRSAQRSLR